MRDYLPRETRLLSEYLTLHHPAPARILTQVRLGAIGGDLVDATLSEAERRLLGTWRRWADALVVTPTRLLLYEAAIIPTPGDLGVLLHYLQLFPHTPELHEWSTRPVVGRLLWAIDSPVLRTLAATLGLETVIFHPPWLHDYLQTLRRRESRPARPRSAVTTG